MMRDGKVVPTVFDCITYLPDIKAYFQNMETKYPDDRQFRMYKEIIDESLNLLNEQPKIVRCIDCKWYPECFRNPTNNSNWFCADGKRNND